MDFDPKTGFSLMVNLMPSELQLLGDTHICSGRKHPSAPPSHNLDANSPTFPLIPLILLILLFCPSPSHLLQSTQTPSAFYFRVWSRGGLRSQGLITRERKKLSSTPREQPSSLPLGLLPRLPPPGPGRGLPPADTGKASVCTIALSL